MSSTGILVVSNHQLSMGERLELRIDWPSLLDDKIPLQLVTDGRVVRCSPSAFAVALDWHQFRTMGSKVSSSEGSPLGPTGEAAIG